ncbi:D-glycero-beta-D-manno-heptose 1-phosphate adenylyltransferase [Nocardioides gansuensis]|uniref:D-glycero-beta-D-manno-heptose 1-phosphate adenylyltransferase n=1 Tax=Nocardioides gansuensis TaxID=2138300 RepID=A0A2T8F9L7_9ACTN|nr:D-glycero-beta-D-manno-heptose 1-phosphate adenylyltransferase [Nocardioides gansuensis]PVG82428.1 D-glycero-beta-D-manno-heptose 1-phosphate adenylyltransferase [Nocardioides gansuensis]
MTRGPLVVVGDVLLDVDVCGSVSRTAPDSPAPVVDVVRRVERPGGAGLAAWLATGDGSREVVLLMALGSDDEAQVLRRRLAERVRLVEIGTTGRTTVKARVRADGQTLLRMDRGDAGDLGDVPPEAGDVLASASGVLVSDYGRGVSSHPGVRALLAAVPRRAPVVWDPHPRGADPVSGTLVATPNEGEVRRFAGDPAPDLAGLSRSAAALVERWEVRALAVTRGAAGALLSYGAGIPVHLPAPEVPGRPVDTCGAGDRFAASVALALAEGALIREAVGTAVVAAADFVRDGAAATCMDPRPRVPRTSGDAVALAREVRAGGGTVVATGGCFDLLHRGHVETLQAARRLGDCLVVCLNSDDSVRRLKGPDRPIVPQEDRARVLTALDCVDAVVVFEEDTPNEVLRTLRPHVWCKGGDYSDAALPEEQVLLEWGGQAVTLPYLAGRSTTRLARATQGGEP